MYNWRLLLLAFFAVFQPIASFNERNLVDGRQQCCDHRLTRDSAYSLYGDNRFKSESRRINDQSREIHEVRRDERQNENIPVSRPAITSSRDSYRLRELRESPELRSRLSRTEFHRERESRLEFLNGFITPERRARTFRVTDTVTDRILSAENRRDNRFRAKGIEKSRIFRTRNVNENIIQLNLERRTFDSRQETRLMRDNAEEVRRLNNIRDTREEFRRTRDNLIGTNRIRNLDNQRIQQDESLNRRVSAARFVLRNQRSVRSLDRLSRGGNDERKLSSEVVRFAKQIQTNHDVRVRERNDVRIETEQKNNEIPVIQRSEVNRQIGSRFSMTRKLVLRTQRSVRSLDRLSRGSNDDRRLFFENVRIAKQEGENHNVRARERDEVRNAAERRSIEIRVKERPEDDREIGTRFSTSQHVVIRTHRSASSLDRLSRDSNDHRRFSFEHVRIAKRERENSDSSTKSRNVRALERNDVANVVERRNIVIRVRERSEVGREIDSRFSLTRQVDNNRERRLSIDSRRRNNELKISTNFGDRITRERKNEDGHRSDQRVSRERNDYNRRSFDFQLAARAREQTDERITNQMRNTRVISRDNIRDNIRDVIRAKEITERRLSRSETRLFEYSRSLYSRDSEINEYRRTVDKRVDERMQNQRVQLREIASNFEQREDTPRTHIRKREEQSDENRAFRGRTIERRLIRGRISSEQRDAREVQQRISERRNFRFRNNESRFRATSSSSSSRLIEREILLPRDNVRDVELRKTRDVHERKDSTRNVIVTKTTERQNIDSGTKSNIDISRTRLNTFGYKRVENEDTAHQNNWQYLIYTMQVIYLCSIFIPMLMSNNSDKKKVKSLGLWTPIQKLIKTD